MSLETWLIFCVAEIFLCFSPGPAVIYVLSQGLKSGFKPGLVASAGIVSGNTIYFIISATGLGALLLTSHSIFVTIKWLGAGYLIWTGIKYVLSKPEKLHVNNKIASVHLPKIFKIGMLVQLSNPKNLIFFIAILPQFININNSIAQQVLILGITSQIIETLVLIFYSGIAGKMEQWVKHKDIHHYIDKASGGALIFIGAGLLFFNNVGN